MIAEPRRRQILALVWDRELPASDIAASFDITFGAVSQHLGILREADFVTVRRDGNRRYYQANQTALGPYRELLESMWKDTLKTLADEIQRNEGTADGGD